MRASGNAAATYAGEQGVPRVILAGNESTRSYWRRIGSPEWPSRSALSPKTGGLIARLDHEIAVHASTSL